MSHYDENPPAEFEDSGFMAVLLDVQAQVQDGLAKHLEELYLSSATFNLGISVDPIVDGPVTKRRLAEIRETLRSSVEKLSKSGTRTWWETHPMVSRIIWKDHSYEATIYTRMWPRPYRYEVLEFLRTVRFQMPVTMKVTVKSVWRRD